MMKSSSCVSYGREERESTLEGEGEGSGEMKEGMLEKVYYAKGEADRAMPSIKLSLYILFSCL